MAVPLFRRGCGHQPCPCGEALLLVCPGEQGGSPRSPAAPQTPGCGTMGDGLGLVVLAPFPGTSGPSWAESRAGRGSVSSICSLVNGNGPFLALTPCPEQPLVPHFLPVLRARTVSLASPCLWTRHIATTKCCDSSSESKASCMSFLHP